MPRSAEPERASTRVAATSRRRFLQAGAAGAVVLAIASATVWIRSRDRAKAAANALDADARAVLSAIVPAMLAGALPAAPGTRAAAITDTLAAIERAIAGLAPSARDELGRLFSLLALTPGRRVFAGVASPWSEASNDEVDAFLAHWQASRWALKRSAYDGLHQLVMAAWYAQPRAWADIGYPGPPSLAV